MPSDMRTVYRAASVEEADIIVAWLDEHGVSALIKDRAVASVLDIPVLYTPHGIEICVPDPDQAELAVALLEDHYRRQAGTDADDRTVETVCEECGKTSLFPHSQRGLVQTCPHCDDVPEPQAGRLLGGLAVAMGLFVIVVFGVDVVRSWTPFRLGEFVVNVLGALLLVWVGAVLMRRGLGRRRPG